MNFTKKNKFLKLSILLAAVAAPLIAFLAAPLHVNALAAGGVYGYGLDATTHKLFILCQGEFGQPTPECPDITSGTKFSTVTSQYNYVANSKYTFKSTGNPAATITISDPNHPENGIYKYANFNGGKAATVTLGSPEIFKTYFGLIGKGATVNLKVNVDFGKTDPTLAIPPNQGLTVQISPVSTTLGGEILLNSSQAKILSPNPVPFSTAISGLKAGTTYHICVNGSYTIGSDGQAGGSVCKDVTATATGQTITINIKGDPSVLKTTQCIQQTGNTAACTSTSSTDQAALDCGTKAFNWLVCPVMNLLQGAAEQLDGFITSQLNVDTGNIFSSNHSTAYHAAWNSFRILATAVIVIAGLVMVASQALGFEFLDAYTIRKILPRLLIAIIGISLSWPLLQFIIDFFNVLGADIRQLIYTPFNSIAQNGGIGGLVTATWVLAPVAVGGALFIYGPAVLTFLLTGFLALFIAFLVLVIRQIAIILLVILAPIAIAGYILPNTQKVWKLWSDNFFGLMLMFPIITSLIAAGHVFAAVARTGGIFQQFVGIIAYFIPYFLLPFAFRLATGAIGTIAGIMNDRGKGVFDRLKKSRGAKATENFGKMKSGTRFTERNPLTRGINRSTVSAGVGWKGRFGAGERGAQAIDQIRRNAAMNEVMKSAGWNAIQHDDDALKALTYDSAKIAKKAGVSDRAIAAAQTSVGFGRPQAIAAAQQLSSTGTGYKNIKEVAETIARASGGDASTIASVAGFINSDTKRAGRHDLAPGFGTLNDLSRQAAGLSSTSAVEDRLTGARRAATLGDAAESAWASGSLYQHANDKGANIQNAIDHHTSLLSSRQREDRERAAVFFNELKSMQPNATGDVKDKIQKALDGNRAGLDTLYDSTHTNYLGDSAAGVADRSTGRTETQLYDPTTGNYTKQVVSTGARSENALERVERLSRTYERPDPNTIP